jgi:hypothetical protein
VRHALSTETASNIASGLYFFDPAYANDTVTGVQGVYTTSSGREVVGLVAALGDLNNEVHLLGLNERNQLTFVINRSEPDFPLSFFHPLTDGAACAATITPDTPMAGGPC